MHIIGLIKAWSIILLIIANSWIIACFKLINLKLEHSASILSNFETFKVLKFDKSNNVNELQPSNIFSI